MRFSGSSSSISKWSHPDAAAAPPFGPDPAGRQQTTEHVLCAEPDSVHAMLASEPEVGVQTGIGVCWLVNRVVVQRRVVDRTVVHGTVMYGAVHDRGRVHRRVVLGVVDRRCVGERGTVVYGTGVASAMDVGDGLISVHAGGEPSDTVVLPWPDVWMTVPSCELSTSPPADVLPSLIACRRPRSRSNRSRCGRRRC